MILIKYISTTFLAHYFMSWLPCKQRLHFYCVSWRVKSSLCRQLFNFSTVHARNLSCDSQAKLIVSCVVKWCEFWGNKEISPTLICYARWVQDSHSAPNRSRTGKSLFFKFILPDFWMSLNGCRQRLLFAHWLTQRKCSLCLQGMSWQVASINISANQNTGFVMEYQVHNPFNQHFWKFLFEVKWNGLFRFSPMEIFGITCEGGPLWLTGLVRLKFPVPFSQIVVSENCLSVSRSQYHWCGKQLILFWKRHLQYNRRRLSSFVHEVRQLLVHDCI